MRKLISTIILLSFLFCLWTPSAKAQVAVPWDSAFAAAVWKDFQETIREIRNGTILGVLKSAAIRSLHQNVGRMLTGQSGKQLFITNWEDFLRAGPNNRTVLYMNDFFGSVYEGRASDFYTAYDYYGGEPGVASPNYARQLQQIARGAVGLGSDARRMRYDLDNYTSDPSQMFSTLNTSSWRAFDSMISNPWNNPFGTSLMTQQIAAERITLERDLARTQSIAYQGFQAQTQYGQVIAPGSVLANVKYSVDKAAMDLYTNASSPHEIVIYAAVDMLVTKLFNEGVGESVSNTMRQIVIPANNTAEAIGQKIESYGPAASYESPY